MFNSTSLVPSSIPLSGGAAIDSILADIPLFCQGIMGMGVFTFLFIAKRVKLISVFLYGSSFLAFAAATLDLGQILARGSENATRDVSLDNITALLFAREIFLALSLSFLNIFFWMLVADCPHEEYIVNSHDAESDISQGSLHSASWGRWGLVGTILKWCSLVALLAAPLLQVLWRLIPSQRRYSTLYVTESTIQTSICLVFTLKLFLNIYLSTLPIWWDAFRRYIPSFLALAFGTSLGIGNLIIFSFSESSLGRFLRAVEVYILIIQSLHATLLADRRYHARTSPDVQTPVVFFPQEKSPSLLPIEVKSIYNSQPRDVLESNILLYRQPQQIALRVPAFPAPKPPVVSDIAAPINRISSQEQFDVSPSPSVSQTRQRRDRRLSGSTRQSSVVDLSYYSNKGAGDAQVKQEPSLDNASVMDLKNGSKRPSITSLDELLLQRNEMDRSIATLRFEATQSQIFPGEVASTMEGRTRSTIGQSSMTRTESISGRSEFSLSVFPDPPAVPSDEVATKYVIEDTPTYSKQSRPPSVSEQVATVTIVGAGDSNPSGDLSRSEKLLNSIGELDVTSFIGGGDAEFFYDQDRLSNIDDEDDLDANSGGDRTTISAPSTVIGPAITLRPMILASALISSPTDRGRLPAPSAYGVANPNRSPSAGSDSPSSLLKPLFLGRPLSSMPPAKTGSLVPLAQRRQRGGTISNVRRPLNISNPRMREDAMTAGSNPSDFERPRPPPLRLR